MTSSQGHSALRDPERSVFASFPEADGYRPLERHVDRHVRTTVEAELPFKIHFNELGTHTVYAALRGRRPLGLIHVRTEEGKWGLIELEWRLNLDLTIRGFQFHRCRSQYREDVETSAFAKSLIGLDEQQLSELLTEDGAVADKAGTVPDGGEVLAASVLRSAIKTLVLTRCVWGRDIARLRDDDLGLRSFADGSVVRRLLPPQDGSRDGPIRVIRAIRVFDDSNRPLGRVFTAEIPHEDGTLALEWTLDSNGRILQIDSVDRWPDAKTLTEFKQLEGKLVEAQDVGSAWRVATELLAMVNEMKEPGAK